MTAELTEHSPIIIQNSSNPSSQKIWMYDRTTVQGATFDMRGQLYRGQLPTPWLCPVFQWSVQWALSWTTWVLVLAGARRCALEMCGKKNVSSAFRLG